MRVTRKNRRGTARHHETAPRHAAFTLIEVLLAVGIAAGLLFVALFFNQQAGALRSALLEESNRLTAARQIMGQLTRELACLAPEIGTFEGSETSISFVWRKPPSLTPIAQPVDPAEDAWVESILPRNPSPPIESPVCRRVRYELPTAANGSNGGSLQRSETTADTTPSTPPPPESGSVLPPLNAAEPEAGSPGQAVAFAGIEFARFRFYDGREWVDTWQGREPPLGVEVTLGFQPASPTGSADEYPGDLFRRLIPVLSIGPAPADPAGDPPETAGFDSAFNGWGEPGPDRGGTP